MGGSYQQEVDLISLFKDVCSEYVQMCTVGEKLPNLHRPGDPGGGERGDVRACLIFPSDVMELKYEAPAHAFKQVPSSLGLSGIAGHPRRGARCGRPPTCSMAGTRVAMLVGQGARGLRWPS